MCLLRISQLSFQQTLGRQGEVSGVDPKGAALVSINGKNMLFNLKCLKRIKKKSKSSKEIVHLEMHCM